jgi:phosphatidylserine decarboxylase
MISRYARREALAILGMAVMLGGAACVIRLWWALPVIALVAAALLAFFRDPRRRVPLQRGIMVSPADGRVSSIHQVDPFPPFNEPATCVRIFLSVFNVHINRAPAHARVTRIEFKPGAKLNALSAKAATDNESNFIFLEHPTHKTPVAAVKQIAGMLARTVTCGVRVGEIVQRGQRIGMIKLGSTTELYVPQSLQPQVLVEKGQKVYAGTTTLVKIVSLADQAEGEPSVAAGQSPKPS